MIAPAAGFLRWMRLPAKRFDFNFMAEPARGQDAAAVAGLFIAIF